MQRINRVLISVFDKRNLTALGTFLAKQGAKVLSTGGTLRYLRQHVPSLTVEAVSDYTQHPECLGGRVKSLHPRIHAGLLANLSDPAHRDELASLKIEPIDMVIVNLYPFEKVLAKGEGERDDGVLRENIDIGGPTLLRAAAKNHPHVTVVCDPTDYTRIMTEPNTSALRRNLAAKAFHHVTTYDMAIARYLNPTHRYRAYMPVCSLKYGLNPQQRRAGLYRRHNQKNIPIHVLNGNPGYINMLDAIYEWQLVRELQTLTGSYAVASFKHTSPAGVALDTGVALSKAERTLFMLKESDEVSRKAVTFLRARFGDPMSSFGDFVAVSGVVDVSLARMLKREVSDGIIAVGYDAEALALLKSKKKGQYVILQGIDTIEEGEEVREMHGITLIQDANMQQTTKAKVLGVPDSVARDLILANTTLKYTQSNSVCAAVDGQVIGVGAGQQSRVDCVKLVKRKAQLWQLMRMMGPSIMSFYETGTRNEKINRLVANLTNYTSHMFEESEKDAPSGKPICLASDAFFPFSDSIDVASKFGVRYVIQPGGSVGDKKVQEACDMYDIQMVLTGRDMRMFLH